MVASLQRTTIILDSKVENISTKATEIERDG